MKNIFWKKCHSLYSLDIGIGIIGIVIGRYEKKLIGRTLGLKRAARGLRARFESRLSEV